MTTITLISWTRLFSRDSQVLEQDIRRIRTGSEDGNDKISEIETLKDNLGTRVPVDKIESFSGSC